VLDMNVRPLTDANLNWANVVFTSTMIVQKDSLFDVIGRCNRADTPVVSGGPQPTSYGEEIVNAVQEKDGWVDPFLFDEVDETFGDFLTDLSSGIAKDVYPELKKPAVSKDTIAMIRSHQLGGLRFNAIAVLPWRPIAIVSSATSPSYLGESLVPRRMNK